MSDKLPALPARPKSFRAKTFDPYDDVFGYAETKGHMDTQDARIATLVAEAEISDERVTEYRDANRGLGQRIAELDREIREAHRLLYLATECNAGVNLALWADDSRKWLRQSAKRNAERENGK